MSMIGVKIKKLRKEKKLTLAEVAKDQMSPAMLSLIENGKSKPSAENLQHIAQQLQVDVNELMVGKTRSELKRELSELRQIIKKSGAASFKKAIKHIQTLFPYLGNNVESADIYDLYFTTLFGLYQHYKADYDQLEDGDWNKYALLASEIYEDLQMENRVLDIHRMLANIDYLHGNYSKTVEIVKNSLEKIDLIDSKSAQVAMKFKQLQFYSLFAIGEFEESKQLLEENIQLMNTYQLFNWAFELFRMGEGLYYQCGEFDKAREFTQKTTTLVELFDSDYLKNEKEFSIIHNMEFYEDQPEESLRLIEIVEKNKAKSDDTLSELKARCYTKLKQPKKALPLFRQLLRDDQKHIEYHPIDVGIREISKSYQALCYMQLNDLDKALELAEEVERLLRKHPHTAYYQFARGVLRDIQVEKNRG
ncbi:helix-turn-helix domain-containing protein [Bacillus niameyensis]|uniref:helix-turn-helix domain-containing protein n=1 Tax=Bacillus niameyensis TaxID=1522308 RepID=UPI00078545BA|nr:helix-turn-helix transcriptional regulator [Bacillus niameyensis]